MLVTYDNLVMCFTLYLFCPKHDFIEGILFFIKLPKFCLFLNILRKNDFIVIHYQNALFYFMSTTHNLLFKYNNHKYKLIWLNNFYVIFAKQTWDFNNRTTCNKYLYDSIVNLISSWMVLSVSLTSERINL